MSSSSSLFSRDDCVSCPAAPPPCSCAQTESCITISRSCVACPTSQCIPLPTTQAKKSGFSSGALAGAAVGFLLAILLLIAGVIYYRRRVLPRRRMAALEKDTAARDVPASAEAVLSRPDPMEKRQSSALLSPTSPAPNTVTSGYAGQTVNSSVVVDPLNPFADHASIQTAANSSNSTNVIPIAYVPPPQRPERSPEVDLLDTGESRPSLNLSHTNVSDDDMHLRTPRPHYAESTRSNMTQSSVASGMSNASSAVDFIHEVPTIVTPLQGVRQVVGVVKAEVVQAPTTPSARSTPRSSRPTIVARSPLAQSSYTRADLAQETNPFSDASKNNSSTSLSPDPRARPDSVSNSIKSTSTFGPSARRSPTYRDDSRPSSVNSGTGTIIADISSATRVIVGMHTPGLQPTYPPSPARRITPSLSSASSATTENRMSDLSMASSRADSILEAFPFVPPSPISATPARSPQGSTFFSPPSPVAATTPEYEPMPPVNRHVLGLSTFSTASSGLGAFPFQFEGQPLPTQDQRASLDTIALSRDVQAFPLDHDAQERDSFIKPA